MSDDKIKWDQVDKWVARAGLKGGQFIAGAIPPIHGA